MTTTSTVPRLIIYTAKIAFMILIWESNFIDWIIIIDKNENWMKSILEKDLFFNLQCTMQNLPPAQEFAHARKVENNISSNPRVLCTSGSISPPGGSWSLYPALKCWEGLSNFITDLPITHIKTSTLCHVTFCCIMGVWINTYNAKIFIFHIRDFQDITNLWFLSRISL